MKNRLEVLDAIIDYAKRNKNIRAVILQGSLANPINRIDELSDLDPLFYVDNIEEIIKNDDWLNKFGDIMIRLNDEWETEDKLKTYMRMVIYEGGLKVDFGLTSIKSISKINDLMFYKVLLDKDNLIKPLITDSEIKFYTDKPTSTEYQKVVNDFFWDITYIAKALQREEMYFVKYMFENINRHIKKLLSWQLGIKHNWQVNIGLEGRYLKSLLSKETWQKVLATFSGSDVSKNWKAIYASCDLVRELGNEIAVKLDFIYPFGQDIDIVNYLIKIENMDKKE